MHGHEDAAGQVYEPAHLNFACALAGVEPVRLDRAFDYLALGTGQGAAPAALQQGNPNGRFHAADAGAGKLAALAAGQAPLPPMDFIILHGAYSWLEREERVHFIALCNRYLKPGGVAYIGYDAMPGCSSVLPLQRLVREQGRLHGAEPMRQVAQAAAQLAQLRGAGAAYLADNDTAAMRRRLDGIAQADSGLNLEFTHSGWDALYHADVARALADAKLDYAASADLCWSDPERYLTPVQRALLDAQSIPSLRETVHDMLVNTSFRRDVYVRGARRMHPLRQAEWLAGCRLALSPAGPRPWRVPASGVALEGARAKPMLDALAQGPQPLGGLARLSALHGQSMLEVARLAALLVDSGQVAVCPPQVAAGYIGQPPGRQRGPLQSAGPARRAARAPLVPCWPNTFRAVSACRVLAIKELDDGLERRLRG